jgi:MFS family permease
MPSSKHQLLRVFERILISTKSTLSFYPIMAASLGLISIDGISLAMVTSNMLHLLPQSYHHGIYPGLCIYAYSIGCVTGGYLGGRICDRLKLKLSSTLTVSFFCLSCLWSAGAAFIEQLWSAMVACFLWGWSLYFVTANLLVICSRVYGGRPESFALTKQFHSLVFLVYEVVAMNTNNSLPTVYIMLTILIIAVPAILGVRKLSD